MNAKFLLSATSLKDCPNDGQNELCLIGRSNVGKSSLINAIVNLKIAKTSNTPGRTQTLNFYQWNKMRIVDLPGYGYAKVSKAQKELISSFISEYLNFRSNLKAVFQIVDAGVITSQDAQMVTIIAKTALQHYVVANKIDKLTQKQKHHLKQEIANFLKVDQANVFLTSTKTKINLPLITRQMENSLK